MWKYLQIILEPSCVMWSSMIWGWLRAGIWTLLSSGSQCLQFRCRLCWGGIWSSRRTEWESLNGEILDLFFEDRALSVLSLGEEMKLWNNSFSGWYFCGNRGRKGSKMYVCVDFQESFLVTGYRLFLISGTHPLENLPWQQERDGLDILKKKTSFL